MCVCSCTKRANDLSKLVSKRIGMVKRAHNPTVKQQQHTKLKICTNYFEYRFDLSSFQCLVRIKMQICILTLHHHCSPFKTEWCAANQIHSWGIKHAHTHRTLNLIRFSSFIAMTAAACDPVIASLWMLLLRCFFPCITVEKHDNNTNNRLGNGLQCIKFTVWNKINMSKVVTRLRFHNEKVC